uniref:Secreted protein n=1 Tax=Cacopsylla melanoneura TaxID=428564 RepID=A0A8D8Y753_9HEMI
MSACRPFLCHFPCWSYCFLCLVSADWSPGAMHHEVPDERTWAETGWVEECTAFDSPLNPTRGWSWDGSPHQGGWPGGPNVQRKRGEAVCDAGTNLGLDLAYGAARHRP